MTDLVTAPTLTAKEQRFVAEYLTDLNATQAAIRAGYSERSATAIGAENLRKPHLAVEIAKAQAVLAQKTDITHQWVLGELAKVARGDVRKLFDDKGNLRAIHELDDDTAAAISSIEVVTRPIKGSKTEVQHVHKIRLLDKTNALTQIGRHLGMFKDKLELSGTLTLEALVLESLKAKTIEGEHRVVEPDAED